MCVDNVVSGLSIMRFVACVYSQKTHNWSMVIIKVSGICSVSSLWSEFFSLVVELENDVDGNMYEILRPVRCKNREKYTQKNNYTQENIYVVRKFFYVYGLTRFSLFLGKNTECGSTVFFCFLFKNNFKILISKSNSFYILRTGFIVDYRKSQIFFKKCPIKNCNNIISG